jgi:hypothetical protein
MSKQIFGPLVKYQGEEKNMKWEHCLAACVGGPVQ